MCRVQWVHLTWVWLAFCQHTFYAWPGCCASFVTWSICASCCLLQEFLNEISHLDILMLLCCRSKSSSLVPLFTDAVLTRLCINTAWCDLRCMWSATWHKTVRHVALQVQLMTDAAAVPQVLYTNCKLMIDTGPFESQHVTTCLVHNMHCTAFWLKSAFAIGALQSSPYFVRRVGVVSFWG